MENIKLTFIEPIPVDVIKSGINQRTDIKWNPYLACAYAEGFCEGGDATIEEQVEAFAYIAKNKLYLTLQGWFGRTLRDFILADILDIDGVINWEEVDFLTQ